MRVGRWDVRRQVGLGMLAAAIWGAALAGVALGAQPTVQVRFDERLGFFLTGPEGRTLYVFARDVPGTSNCYGNCEQIWPPLVVDPGPPVAPPGLPGQLGTTTRRDGRRQVTYNGWPLYYWVGDTAPGQANGQGVNDVWWVANLAPTVQVRPHPQFGQILVGPTGLTLYTFARDQAGASNCYDTCEQNWPPLRVAHAPLAPEGLEGALGVITRRDGTLQVTYEGLPLYYWIADRVPEDTYGHGVNDVWFVAQP